MPRWKWKKTYEHIWKWIENELKMILASVWNSIAGPRSWPENSAACATCASVSHAIRSTSASVDGRTSTSTLSRIKREAVLVPRFIIGVLKCPRDLFAHFYLFEGVQNSWLSAIGFDYHCALVLLPWSLPHMKVCQSLPNISISKLAGRASPLGLLSLRRPRDSTNSKVQPGAFPETSRRTHIGTLLGPTLLWALLSGLGPNSGSTAGGGQQQGNIRPELRPCIAQQLGCEAIIFTCMLHTWFIEVSRAAASSVWKDELS